MSFGGNSQTYFSLGQIRLHPEFQLPRQTPSERKVRGRKERKKGEVRRIMPESADLGVPANSHLDILYHLYLLKICTQ